MKSRLSNELAILSNEVGGIFELSEILDLDPVVIDMAIRGEDIDRIDNTDINKAWAEFEGDVNLQRSLGVDLDAIDDDAAKLRDIMTFIGYAGQPSEVQRYDVREQYAEGLLDRDQFIRGDGWEIFSQLPIAQVQTIIDAAATGVVSWMDAMDAYLEDPDLWNVKDSLFWAWFRENFYGE